MENRAIHININQSNSIIMATIKVLVVDDKSRNLTDAKNQFTDKNVELICSPMFSIAVELLKRHKFDVVLTDLMLPGESEGIGDNNPEIGKEVPYGLVLSILAKNMGVPHVAILTDISHHSGPIAWAMDNLLGDHEFVSCFEGGNKNWLKAAEKFVSISDIPDDAIETAPAKKSLMLIGNNDTYKESLRTELE